MSTKIIATGTAATAVMSLFSYWLSERTHEQFREPEVLGELLFRAIRGIKKSDSRTIGWSLHLSVGLLFAKVYSYLWQQKTVKPTARGGLLLGGISGAVAIVVWKTVLSVHPCPPKLKFKKYYLQLLPAHVLFGLTAVIVYNALAHRARMQIHKSV